MLRGRPGRRTGRPVLGVMSVDLDVVVKLASRPRTLMSFSSQRPSPIT